MIYNLSKKRFAIYVITFSAVIFYGLFSFFAPNSSSEFSVVSQSYNQNINLQDFPLSAHYSELVRQINSSFCGPASVVNVLRSLGIIQFDQTSIFDHVPLGYYHVRFTGTTLDEIGTLLSASANIHYAAIRDISYQKFMWYAHLFNDTDKRFIINFDSAFLYGSGPGHHSPVGGYDVERDLVLIMDVNRGPILAPSRLVYNAMNTASWNNIKRGMVMVTMQ